MPSTENRPLHERYRFLGWLRRPFRALFFGMARRWAATDEGRDTIHESLAGVHDTRPRDLDRLPLDAAPAYADLGTAPAATDGEGTIIISGRFRSGSTLLWNLFRHMSGFTAYYEPHNERRWFDPSTRGDRIDPTHKNVSDYWAEYEGQADLANHFRDDWAWRNFLMDENAWDADLLAYTRLLIARARGRAVLQCNRIDFRLAWHRRHFPKAKIVHLYRHPRDQWCSALQDIRAVPPDAPMSVFEPRDYFYLLRWTRDLVHHFPFLDERKVSHAYPLFYLVWKLSYLFGQRDAHHSLSLEDLVDNPDAELQALFDACDIDPATQDVGKLKGLIVRPEFGKWRKYADEGWFRKHEEWCEGVLADFLGRSQGCPVVPAAKAACYVS